MYIVRIYCVCKIWAGENIKLDYCTLSMKQINNFDVVNSEVTDFWRGNFFICNYPDDIIITLLHYHYYYYNYSSLIYLLFLYNIVVQRCGKSHPRRVRYFSLSQVATFRPLEKSLGHDHTEMQ